MIAAQTRIPLIGGTCFKSTNARLYAEVAWGVLQSGNFQGENAGVPVNLASWLRFDRLTVQNQGSISLRVTFDAQMDLNALVSDYPLTLGTDVLPGETRVFDLSTVVSSVGIRRMLYLIDLRSAPITNMWHSTILPFNLVGEFYNVAQSAVP